MSAVPKLLWKNVSVYDIIESLLNMKKQRFVSSIAAFSCLYRIMRAAFLRNNPQTLLHYFSSNASISSNQMRPQASDGILRSPLGDTAIVPTFGPSGRQERLNCCEKNLQ